MIWKTWNVKNGGKHGKEIKMTNFEDRILDVMNEEDVPVINLFLFLTQVLYNLAHDITISVSRELTPLELSVIEMIGNVRDSLKPNLDKIAELKDQYLDEFEVR